MNRPGFASGRLVIKVLNPSDTPVYARVNEAGHIEYTLLNYPDEFAPASSFIPLEYLLNNLGLIDLLPEYDKLNNSLIDVVKTLINVAT